MAEEPISATEPRTEPRVGQIQAIGSIPRIEGLISSAIRDGEVDKIPLLLELCDRIMFSHQPQLYAGEEYGPNDLPSDAFYETTRKTYAPDYQTHRDFPLSGEKSVKHKWPMGSLTKISPTEFSQFNTLYHRIPKEEKGRIFVDAKADGESLRCEFECTPKGCRLMEGVTRYTHTEGILITDKVRHFVKLPALPFQGRVTARGEVLYAHEDFDRVSTRGGKIGYRTKLAAVVGILGQKTHNIGMLSKLSWVVYEIIDYQPSPSAIAAGWPEKVPTSQVDQRNLIRKMGWETTPHILCSVSDLSANFLQGLIDRWRKELPYAIDGVVISPTEYVRENVDTPIMKVAFKGLMEGEWTRVDRIEPRAERTGIVIPQVYIEMVRVRGSDISTIAGANYAKLLERGIRVGSRVKVIKSGTSIPFIDEIDNESVATEPVILPTKCPSCSSDLSTKDRFLKCLNPLCPAKASGQTLKYVVEIGIVGIAKVTLEKICAAQSGAPSGAQSSGEKETGSESETDLLSIEDLYNLSVSDLMAIPGIGAVKAKSFYEQLRNRIKDIDQDVFLNAIAPPLIGKLTAKKIISHMPIETLFGETTPSMIDLKEIEDVGEKKAEQLANYWRRGRDLIAFLKTHGLSFSAPPTPAPRSSASTDTSHEVVCFTGRGERHKTKAEYAEMIKAKRPNWEVTYSYTKKVTILVTDSESSGSDKMKRAKADGKRIITYAELEILLAK